MCSYATCPQHAAAIRLRNRYCAGAWPSRIESRQWECEQFAESDWPNCGPIVELGKLCRWDSPNRRPVPFRFVSKVEPTIRCFIVDFPVSFPELSESPWFLFNMFFSNRKIRRRKQRWYLVWPAILGERSADSRQEIPTKNKSREIFSSERKNVRETSGEQFIPISVPEATRSRAWQRHEERLDTVCWQPLMKNKNRYEIRPFLVGNSLRGGIHLTFSCDQIIIFCLFFHHCTNIEVSAIPRPRLFQSLYNIFYRLLWQRSNTIIRSFYISRFEEAYCD